MASWSKAALKLQFESVARMFQPGVSYIRWVVDMQVEKVVREGHWWNRHDVTYVQWRNDVLLPMQEVSYKRTGDSLVFTIPNLEADFNGRVLGCNFYSHPDSSEYIMFAPFKGNTSRVVKGGSVILDRVVLEVEGMR